MIHLKPQGPFPTIVVVVFALWASSCSSCGRPAEPVLPADLSGNWQGSYTVYDGRGRPLTDSITVTLTSEGESVNGEGLRRRFIVDQPPQEADVVVAGSVSANSFRLELADPGTGHTAVFSGTVEDDTLRGNLIVDGTVLGTLDMAHIAAQGTQKSADL